MAFKKKIELNEEHIKLISCIKFEKFLFDEKEHFETLKGYVSDLILSDKSKGVIESNEYTTRQINEFNPNSRFGWGIDQWSLFGGTFLLEDMSMILGFWEKAIPGSENSPNGRRFPEEYEEKMYSLYDYIVERMDDIIELVFTFSSKGGITPGVYVYDDFVWKKEDK